MPKPKTDIKEVAINITIAFVLGCIISFFLILAYISSQNYGFEGIVVALFAPGYIPILALPIAILIYFLLKRIPPAHVPLARKIIALPFILLITYAVVYQLVF